MRLGNFRLPIPSTSRVPHVSRFPRRGIGYVSSLPTSATYQIDVTQVSNSGDLGHPPSFRCGETPFICSKPPASLSLSELPVSPLLTALVDR